MKATTENKWKWTTSGHRDGVTGKYGGSVEFTNGRDLLIGVDAAQESDYDKLTDCLNALPHLHCSGCASNAFVISQHIESVERLKEVNALCQGFIETLLVGVAEGRLNLEDDESGDVAREVIAFAETLLQKMQP